MRRSKGPRICFDRRLPGELDAPPPADVRDTPEGILRAVFLVGKLWPAGSTIRVAFLGGTAAQQSLVRKHAPKWCEHANLTLEFLPSLAGSHVRIAFNPGAGAWSYLGRDCLSIPADQPTMNLGWQDEAVTLHEFGHMLALGHEHQSPRDNPIVWDEEKVYAVLGGPPNFWDRATVKSNVFGRYSVTQTNGSTFDPDSVMLYAFPRAWTKNGISTHANPVLSELDKLWAQKVYPGRAAPPPPVLALEVGPAPQPGEIAAAGEEDRYSFSATTPGRYTVETLGDSDTLLSVLDAAGTLLGSDDDAGEDRNARLSLTLEPGVYTISCRHYSTGTGKYSIQVRRG